VSTFRNVRTEPRLEGADSVCMSHCASFQDAASGEKSQLTLAASFRTRGL
jgi:hypothetical protein